MKTVNEHSPEISFGIIQKDFVPCVSFAIQEIDLSSIDRHPLHDPSTEDRSYVRLKIRYLL